MTVPKQITVEQAQDMKKELEIGIMKEIRLFEETTGLRISKAEMIPFENTRFFTTSVWMPPRRKKDNG